MKFRHCITVLLWVILTFSLAACHSPQREARRMVRRAERLFDTLPDSTARLIDSVLRMPVYFNEKHRMDMALLQAEALFGDRGSDIPPLMDDDFFDDKPTLSTSPELERAAAYYAKKMKYDKAAHAALYSGFVQQHYNDKTAAMQSFKDAEHYGGRAQDSLAVAQAEYWMGKMLFSDYMEEEAIVMLKSADTKFGNLYTERAFVNNIEAIAYIVLKQYDDAELCLKQGLVYSEHSDAVKAKQRTLNNYAVLFRLQGKYEQALDCLRQTEDKSDSTKLTLYYLNMGKVFNAFGEKDSTIYYYQELENVLPKANVKNETKISAYGALSRFAESQGNNTSALQYLKMREKLTSEIQSSFEKKSVYRIQKQYDYENLQNTMNRKLVHKQRIIVIGIVLFLGIVALFLYRSAQRNKKEAEINANLFHFMQQNKELIQHNAEHEKRYYDQNLQLSNLLTDKFHAMQKLDCYLKGQGDKIILKDLEKNLFEGKDHLRAIMELLDELYPDLRETLKTKYPEMSDLEQQVYILSRYKLPRVEEASLLGISTSVLDKVRGRVRKMMENTP